MERAWLLERSMHPELIDLIVERMAALNQEIRAGPLLGENYQVGQVRVGRVTRVLGVFGATAACCRLLHLDVRRTSAALGIAASMASGIRPSEICGSIAAP